MTIDPMYFHFLLPGERRIAYWGSARIRHVQGHSRQLVAGAYVILAAIWGSLGGVVVLSGIIVESTLDGPAGPTLLLVGLVLIVVGVLRQIQSRNARARGDP